jgi:hypothetical protein
MHFQLKSTLHHIIKHTLNKIINFFLLVPFKSFFFVSKAFFKKINFFIFYLLQIMFFFFMFSNRFDVLMSKIFIFKNNIILMYFQVKNNHYHTFKHPLSLYVLDKSNTNYV